MQIVTIFFPDSTRRVDQAKINKEARKSANATKKTGESGIANVNKPVTRGNSKIMKGKQTLHDSNKCKAVSKGKETGERPSKVHKSATNCPMASTSGVKAKGRSSEKSPKVPELKIQEKYVGNSVLKIMIRGNQAIIEDHEGSLTVYQLTETNVENGEQILKLSVDADDSFANSDSESDGVNQPENESQSESEFSDENEGYGPDNVPFSPEVMHKDEEAQMAEIDDDMAKRLKEISKYINSGDMKKSKKVLEECFNFQKGKSPKERTIRTETVVANKLTQFRLGVNTNANHIPDQLNIIPRSRSMETIYKNAVEKRVSSSSEECVDISDENLNLEYFTGYITQDVIPEPNVCEPELTPAQKAEQLILEAEAAKAKMFPNPPGKNALIQQHLNNVSADYQFIAQIDEDYLLIRAHIDEATRNKIVKGEYVDFGKLLPKDRILAEDGRLELMVRNGRTFWVPAAANEAMTINNFSKWEQAFRIYSNVYTRAYPHKSSELIQYNHVIHSIASQYIWENVYNYDKEFRMHIANHPQLSWSVILQQAWSMRLRYCIRYDSSNHHANSGGHGSHTHSHQGHVSNHGKGYSEPCRKFNHGKCNFGLSCKFDHHCVYKPCNKFGHSILNCRKLAADHEKGLTGGNNTSSGVNTKGSSLVKGQS